MPSLSFLLVTREVASMRAVEEAIARQVLHGGDLPTNLIELGVVAEAELLPVLAESFGLPAAPAGSLVAPADAVLGRVPADLARRHGVFPLELHGRTLTIAVAEPLPPTTTDDLCFALDLDLRQAVSTVVRIRTAIAGYYGIPLEPRMARLLARLEGRPDPYPSQAPPAAPGAAELPRSASIPAPTFGAGVLARLQQRPHSPEAQPAPEAAWPPSPTLPSFVYPDLSPPGARPRQIADEPTVTDSSPYDALYADEPTTLGEVGVDGFPTWAQPEEAIPPAAERASVTAAPASAADLRSPTEPASGADEPSDPGGARALASWVERRRPPSAALLAVRPRRKGPLTASMAEEELERATSSDEVLDTLFAFAQQYFAYSALFVVHREIIAGRDAAGAGASREAVVGVGLPLARQGVLSLACGRKAPVITELDPESLDAELARGLERTQSLGAAIAVLPVVVRGRAVALVYGDDGPSGVELSALGEIVALSALAARAIEREIVRRKLGRSAPAELPPPPPGALESRGAGRRRADAEPRADRMSALARTLSSEASATAPTAAPDATTATAPIAAFAPPALSEHASPPPAAPSTDLPPSAPPAARRVTTFEGPSVIVDVSAEYASLIEQFCAGGPGADEAFSALARAAEAAVPLLVARFPGPLRVDRHRARDQLPAASRCGPVLELLAALRLTAVPHVVHLSASADFETRFWATHLLGELCYPESGAALVALLFDADPSVRRVARRSAAILIEAGAAGRPLLECLEATMRASDVPLELRTGAATTIGEIRAVKLVPALIDALADGSVDVADAARRALLLLTRQDFDRDLTTWRAWWAENGSRRRVEWLIDALTHDVPSLRRAAGDELKQITKEYFGYYDDLPRKERERAQGRYRTWWEAEGHRRFG